MKRLVSILAAACLAVLALAALPAQAKIPANPGSFAIEEFDVSFANGDGTVANSAGSHPFSMTTSLAAAIDGDDIPEGRLRDLFFEQIPGLVADTTAYKRCSNIDFLELDGGINACPPESQLGINASAFTKLGSWATSPVFNLVPPPGSLLRLGFRVANTANIAVDVGLSPKPPHRPIARVRNAPQLQPIYGNKLELWGNPSAEAHDGLRGVCGFYLDEGLAPGVDAFQFEEGRGVIDLCPVERRSEPLLTLPTNCSGPLASDFEALSWEGESDAGSRLTHDLAGNPEGFKLCGALPSFDPTISAQPTTRAAASPTGLDFGLAIEDPGLRDVDGRAKSQIRRAVVKLPAGMTANPSLAEGLQVCSEADLDRETLGSIPGAGCPQASKIGTIEVESPLVDETVHGALYQAAPFANLAGDSLIAFYIVLKNPKLGVIVKQPVKVEADAETGRLTAITDEIPQLPFSSFQLKFREGGRSPLVSPSTCGSHRVTAELTPWSGAAPHTTDSTFEIASGPGAAPCPSGGPPFEPGFEAGSHNNAAGAFSTFAMRLTRRDGDQDLTRFDATLPRGVLARLAGVSKCPNAQIALAGAKTGRAELASPSCPLNSRIGGVKAGAGVGTQLTYVPGTVYLAGPFGGAPLSAVAIVPAVAGPFDVGTVVYRQALRVDPRTAEVTADGALSPALPRILAGIPLVVRDIQVQIDRSGFTLNPTSCEAMATGASLWGSGGSLATRSAPFQAAGCARLGFRPRLGLRLRGGTRRGANPALRAVLHAQPGQANIERTVVRLPRSAFLDQSHIRTICTRVQFAADRCPRGAIYGQVTAFSPLLDEPLRGPAYLRSSDNTLPDLVFALRGIVDIEAAARIDSIRGGIRAIFPAIPDAPLSRVVVRMQGGKKGLIVNSRNLCRGKNRANIRFDGHNGKRVRLRPVLRPQCGKKQRKAQRGSHRAGLAAPPRG